MLAKVEDCALGSLGCICWWGSVIFFPFLLFMVFREAELTFWREFFFFFAPHFSIYRSNFLDCGA